MIAYRPAKQGKRGSNIPNDVIDRSMNRHPDGFGVAWRDFDGDGTPRLNVAKFGPDEKSAFRAELKRVDSLAVEYVAHFRWATQGPTVQRLAHPYEYEDATEGRVLVFHNGIIDIAAEKSESDTEVFVRDVLAYLPSGWWRNPALRFLVNSAIAWSKLVIMTATETVNLHESRGDWDGGLWYSSEHKAYKSYSSGKGGSGYATGTVRSAEASAEAFGCANPALLTEGDLTAAQMQALNDQWPESDGLLPGGPTVRVWQQPTNMGHAITELVVMSRDKDQDYPDGVVCNECKTSGDAYVIDGQVWYDVAHRFEDEDEDEKAAADEAALARLANVH